MIILTLNCGSSSAKFQIYDWENQTVLGSGMVERIGQPNSRIEFSAAAKEEYEAQKPCPTHIEAIQLIMDTIADPKLGCIRSMDEVKAVGHRMLHGGEKFKKSVLIDDRTLAEFKSLIPLGPLHMPANIQGVEAARKVLPNIPHCAVMDTAWHQTMEAPAFMYPLPYEWYTKYNIRRYGFHGTSFLYTAKRAAVLLGKSPKETNLIIAHIGNGASMCAVKNGVCIDTSMGLTPLEGLMMGTRCGDIDPAIVPFMMETLGCSAKEMDAILNKSSGVLGISGKYSDRRDVQAGVDAGDERAKLILEMETYRIKKYIGSYMAALGRVDAIVFTAGVGEMNPAYRAGSVSGLEGFGIKLDEKRNRLSRLRAAETVISADDSAVKIFVIPTDEELVMTEDTFALMQGTYDVHTNFTYSFQSKDYVNKDRAAKLEAKLAENPELREILALPEQWI